jgi:hypothetical protein
MAEGKFTTSVIRNQVRPTLILEFSTMGVQPKKVQLTVYQSNDQLPTVVIVSVFFKRILNSPTVFYYVSPAKV